MEKMNKIGYGVVNFVVILIIYERCSSKHVSNLSAILCCQINEAVRMYQDKEVWHFGHCWDILRHEPKWNDKLLETPTTGRGKTKQPQNAPEDSLQTQSVQAESSLPPRPQGRDNAKKRRAKGYAETSSSSPAVEMLQKMHERGQEIEEQDAKQKQELIDMEKERLQLQKMQWQRKLELMEEQNRLKKEEMETNRFMSESQLMFKKLDGLDPAIRDWVVKKQLDILIRDGVRPPNQGSSGSDSGRSNNTGGA